MVNAKELADSLDKQNESKAQEQKELTLSEEQIRNTKAILDTIVTAIHSLIQFQKSHEPRVSVTNQKLPESIKTPDVQKVVDSLKNIETVLKTPEEDDTRLLDAIKALDGSIKSLPSLIDIPEAPEPLETVTVKNQPDYKPDFKSLETAISSIDVKPVVNVKEQKTDNSDILKALADVSKAISGISVDVPENDSGPVVSAISALQDTINNLSFPVPNYILPFKDVNGKATQAALDDNGNIQRTQYAAFQFDPNDSLPTYIGKNVDPNASDGDTHWQVYKFTYSGSNVTKIVKRVGTWTGRASL